MNDVAERFKFALVVRGAILSTLLISLCSSCGPAPGPPSISAIDPVSGPSGTIVTISGSNFGVSSKVLFDGNSVGRMGSETRLLFTIPYDAATGKHTVQVERDSQTSNTKIFNVTSTTSAPVPNIEGYSVGYYTLAGAGTNEIMNIVLFGTGFDTHSTVVFDGNDVLSIIPGIPIGGLLGAFAQGTVLPGYPADHYDKAIAARLSTNDGNLPALGSTHTAQARNSVTGTTSNTINVVIPNRHVLAEFDRVGSVDWPPTAIWRNNAINSLQRTYTNAGLIIDWRFDQSVQDPNAGADFTDADVSNFSSNHSTLSGDVYTNEWYFHVSLLTTRDEPNAGFVTYGRMFDTNNRQAMVIFVDNLPGDGEYLRSLMHEMGHGFNLTHCEGDAVLQFDAAGNITGVNTQGTTIMNQSWTLANNWGYTFSGDSQTHLTNCPVNEVAPGPGRLAFNSSNRQEGQCPY